MGKMFWIVLAILVLLLCVYCVILLNRMVSLSEKLQKNRKACILVKAGILVGIILLVAFCKASIAFFFYAAIVSLCMEPIYFLFRKRKGMQFLKKSALIPIAVGVVITVVGFFLMRHFVRTDSKDQYSQRYISEIIGVRLEELFELILDEMARLGVRDLPGGVVITGGVSKLDGIAQLARQVMQTRVRIYTPDYIGVRL